jgi:hypothetical protein
VRVVVICSGRVDDVVCHIFVQSSPASRTWPCIEIKVRIRPSSPFSVISDPAAPFHPSCYLRVFTSSWTFRHMTSFVNAHIRKRKALRAKKLKAAS